MENIIDIENKEAVDVMDYMEKTGEEMLILFKNYDSNNELINNKTAWGIQSDKDLKILVARLFVQSSPKFDYKNSGEVVRIKNLIKEIVANYGSDKTNCLKMAQEELNVTFDFSQYQVV